MPASSKQVVLRKKGQGRALKRNGDSVGQAMKLYSTITGSGIFRCKTVTATSFSNNGGTTVGRYYILYPSLSGVNNSSPTSITGFYSNVNTLGASYGLWTYCRVLAVRIKLTVHNQEAFPVVVSVLIWPGSQKTQAQVSNYAQDLRTHPTSTSIALQPSTLNGSMKVMRNGCVTKMIEGGTDTTIASYQGAAATAPSLVNTLYVQVHDVDGSTLFTANGIGITSEIDFVCQGMFPNTSLSG